MDADTAASLEFVVSRRALSPTQDGRQKPSRQPARRKRLERALLVTGAT